MSPVYLALMHHPVVNRHGEIVTTSITHLDVHDIARVAKTYGMAGFFVVTSVPEQRGMMEFMMEYWTGGLGATYHPDRKEAFELVEWSPSLSETCLTIKNRHSSSPKLVATSARNPENSTGFEKLRRLLHESSDPFLILFGTGWGLAPHVIGETDYLLSISAPTSYCHLPVRGAAAIVIDRLMGKE